MTAPVANKAPEIKGLVDKIHGSSFVDGPGVRTTVFLKGCPLRCVWCCDPEGQQPFPEENRLYPQKGIMRVFGEWKTAREVCEIVARDIPFFNASGGGVTIAGGEPTYQSAFCRELIRQCRELRMHIALDTCAYTVDAEGATALEEADLLLFDLKNIDSGEHERNTGLPNKVILENFKRMVRLRKDIVIRVPLIPGYTDTMENIRAIGDFLHQFGEGRIVQIDLLPYNRGGVIRYEMLGRPYPLDVSLKRQNDEYLEEIRETLARKLKGSCPVNLGH